MDMNDSLLNDSLEDKINLKLAKMQFGTTARVSLYKRLHAFVSDGVPLYTALEIIYERYKGAKDMRHTMLATWLDAIRGGSTFPDALQEGGWAPAIEVVLIDAGNRSGNLPNGFDQAIKLAESGAKMKSTVIGSLVYPCVLALMLIGMLAGFSLKMVPIMLEIKEPSLWPESAKGLYTISQFVTGPGIYVLGGGILFIILSIKSLPLWTGKARSYADKIPPWSVYRSYQGSGFMIALAAMLKAGIPLAKSFDLIQGISGRWVAWHISQMQDNLREGLPNGEAMNTGFLDKEVSGDLIDYGRLSNFEGAIYSIGERSIKQGVKAISDGMSIFKSLMLALTGILVGWIYYGFMMLTQSLGQG